MIPLLYDQLRGVINRSTLLGPLNVFQWVEFRAVMSMMLSFLIVTLFGRRVIRWLVKQKIGDNPEFYHRDLNLLMKQKANTPTMGGMLISGAIGTATLLLADLSSIRTGFYVIMALACLVCLFLIGFADDWLKLTSARRGPGSREGLRTWDWPSCWACLFITGV